MSHDYIPGACSGRNEKRNDEDERPEVDDAENFLEESSVTGV